MDLLGKLSAVADEKSFLDFLKALKNDCQENEKEWQNGSIPDFLESAIAWTEDMGDGNKHYNKPENPWRRAADIIYAGKIYE